MGTVLDIAAVTMATEMRRVEAVAHNIANATTAGFKRQIGVAAPFEASLRAADSGLSGATAPGAPSLATRADFSVGRLSQTNNPLHLAFAGAGFFTVRLGEQILYTRSGAFERAADGRVVTPQGAVLQVDGGDLVVGSAGFTVTADGTVVEDERPIGRLQIVDLGPHATLLRAAGSAFMAGDASASRSDSAVVKQGYLEMANVDVGHEMVQLMETMRRFELGQKLLSAHEDMMERAIRRLGDLQS